MQLLPRSDDNAGSPSFPACCQVLQYQRHVSFCTRQGGDRSAHPAPPFTALGQRPFRPGTTFLSSARISSLHPSQTIATRKRSVCQESFDGDNNASRQDCATGQHKSCNKSIYPDPASLAIGQNFGLCMENTVRVSQSQRSGWCNVASKCRCELLSLVEYKNAHNASH